MILIEIIKLRLAMPSTARFLSFMGVLVAGIGAMMFAFGLSAPSPVFLVVGGSAYWLGNRRLKLIGKTGRIGR